jgi:hypothetical protein
MSVFSNGGILGVRNLTSLLEAKGLWNLRSQFLARKANAWPGEGLITISPSVGGVTTLFSGQSLVFSSSGEYTITCSSDINMTVKMWGAGGACGYQYTQNINSTAKQGAGGGGGYTTGVIALQAGSSYIVRIGQGGIRTNSGTSGATYLAGGLVANATYGGAQGGGYSGIFISSVSQANALLIAGGGGGGSDTDFSANGGAGGGSSGQNSPGFSNNIQGGAGGTQSAGGSPSQFNDATAGSALTGGMSISTVNGAGLGGGGGGYFGGGGGNVGGGGGGSGYFKASSPVSSASTTAGSGSTPGNSADSDRSGAGQGGASGSTSGTAGLILITLS